MRFLRVIEGLVASVATPSMGRAPALLFPASTGTADCLTGEPLETSKGPELEPFCLAGGHMSSLGPGVSGVRTDQSATNESTNVLLKG